MFVHIIINNTTENTEKIDSLANGFARIENNHDKKLEALFDVYKQDSDKLSRIETGVSKQEEVILRKIK